MSNWTDHSLCRGVTPNRPGDPDPFYPGENDHSTKTRTHTHHIITTYCTPCPVRATCLAEALRVETTGGHHGIRGGLTGDARRKLTTAQRAALIEAGS